MFDQSLHVYRSLEIVQVFSESPLKVSQTRWLEARKPRVVHQFSQIDKLFRVSPDCQKTLDHSRNEEVECFGTVTAHNIDEFLCQFEIRALKPHVLAW